MTKLERVKKVCKWLIYKGYADTDSGLAEVLGYTKSSFSQLINGKVPLSDSFIDAICNLDSNINKVWIQNETGEILKDIAENSAKANSIKLMREIIDTKDAMISTQSVTIKAQQEVIDALKTQLASKTAENNSHNHPRSVQR